MSTIQTNSITDAAGTGAPDFPNGINAATALIAKVDDTERMRIDSSGNLLVGTTDAAVGNGDTNVGLSLRGDGRAFMSAEGATALQLNRNTSDGTILILAKDGTTFGSIASSLGIVAIKADQATTGPLVYIQNSTTTSLTLGAYASANQYGYIGDASGGEVGIAFVNVAVLPVTSSDGLAADNLFDLGSSTVRWDDIYATNGTIQTSDRTEKQDIEELNDAERRVAVACKGLLRKYRWISSVAEKGDDARIHFGIIAQDLQAAFAAEGLDAGRYAMFISSTWWEHDGKIYDTAEEAPEGATERTRLGVRYPELLAFMISVL